MAIQFNCPYCTVTIQVPDQAAGKRGTCPQCGTKVVVPLPKNAPPAEAAAAPPAPAPMVVPNAVSQAVPFVPQSSVPMPGYPPPAAVPFHFTSTQGGTVPQGFPAPGAFAPLPVYAPASATMPEEPTSVAKKYKQKLRRRHGPALWGAFVAVAVLGAGLAAFFLRPGAKPNLLTGKLTGTRLAKGKLESALVHREWIDGIDEETLGNVLKQMEKRTVKFRSSNDLISMTFQGTPEGIKITATAGPNAELIGVDLSSNKALANWHQKHAAKLSDQCQKGVASTAKRFIQEWAKAEAARDTNHSFGHYHDELGLAALTMGLGAEAVAIVGNTMHGCVAEQQGQLFFLLPAGIDRFELQGREHGKDNFVFPGRFVVDVEASAPIKKPAPKKSNDEPDMADEGDSESKAKAFGKPALNDPDAVDDSMPEKPKKKAMKNDE